MKLFLAQRNFTVGDFDGNRELILAALDAAADAAADVVLLPELATCGYAPQDLLLETAFVEANLRVLDEIIAASAKHPRLLAVVGFVEKTDAGIHNSAALIADGKLVGTQAKTLLSSYDVFDEERYFEPARGWHIFDWQGVKLGVSICKDLREEEYAVKVVPELCKLGAELIVNISASPFRPGRLLERVELLRRRATENGVPIAYCNLVGGQDEVICDGGSMAVGRDGRLAACAPTFEEADVMVEFDPASGDFIGSTEPPVVVKEADLFHALALGVRDFVRKQGFSQVVIGLSGGIDSSLVAVIAADALGAQNVLGVAMPSKLSSAHSLEDAQALAENLGIDFKVMPIEESIAVAEKRFADTFGGYEKSVTRENLQARERGKILMEISNDQNRFVLAPANKTEYALGYSTLYGDMAGALAPIADLSKLEVYAVSRWANENLGAPIPQRVLTKTPSAELAEGQVDPFDYEVISPLVDAIIEERAGLTELVAKGFPETEARRCLRLTRQAEFKRRQAPPMLKVTKKAFGIGRKMPIVNRYGG